MTCWKLLFRRFASRSMWQRTYLSGDRLERELQWWKKEMEGAPPALTLSTDFPRPVQESSRGGLFATLLPLSLLDRVRALSRQEGATVYMVLLAAYSVF